MTDAAHPCVQCGSPVPRNAQFCLVCGTPASAARSQSAALGSVAGQAPAAGPGSAPIDGWRPDPAVEPIREGDLIPAGYGRRVLAFLLDGVFGAVLWLVIVLPLMALGVVAFQTRDTSIAFTGPSAVILLAASVIYPIVSIVLQAQLGFSPGKALMGLRIVRLATLGKVGILRMLLRWLVVAAASLVFLIGQYVVWLSPLWDASKMTRGWHDKLADTWVIDVKAGPNPLKARPGQLLLDESPAPAPVPDARASAARNAGAAPPAAAPVAPPAPPATESFAPIAHVPGFAPSGAGAGAGAERASAPQPAEDDFESTRLSGSGPVSVPAGVIVFRLDTGEVVPITRHGALGRDPVAPGGDPSDLLIALQGDTLSVSKTHLEFGLEGGRVWVSDRGSTNGTALVRSDGAELELDAGERVRVEAGDRIRVGTRVLQVEGSA
ncbi:RDD family protein [Herbiconiux sp. CPCC 205716]|uniref:RDD family protein n=1 Tax=Herbiconiux gentiana TaxID=2970912 RepID=A0ABT2GM47_9MICO|nr:RDD family protein [Herbiconiux gentiana]MCS5715999.1 RDD family protein [Herbiconiux gentiana]